MSFTSVFICNYGNPTDVKENMQKYNSQGFFFILFFVELVDFSNYCTS